VCVKISLKGKDSYCHSLVGSSIFALK
jgi:hypothetical protein